MSRRRNNFAFPQRRAPRFTPRGRVLIVCEGEKTEPDYFRRLADHLQLTRYVEVLVEGAAGGSAPISVVARAVELRNQVAERAASSMTEIPFDEVWCVFDVEAPKPHESLNDAWQKARAHRVYVALSNPCFEYWYILHFEKTSRSFLTNGHVWRRLKKHIPGYRKNDARTFDFLKHRVARAVKHAREVCRERHYGEDLRGCNPSTHVHKVVEVLTEMAATPASR